MYGWLVEILLLDIVMLLDVVPGVIGLTLSECTVDIIRDSRRKHCTTEDYEY
jgi:predicted tellurium resistance membrane protein TerC